MRLCFRRSAGVAAPAAEPLNPRGAARQAWLRLRPTPGERPRADGVQMRAAVGLVLKKWAGKRSKIDVPLFHTANGLACRARWRRAGQHSSADGGNWPQSRQHQGFVGGVGAKGDRVNNKYSRKDDSHSRASMIEPWLAPVRQKPQASAGRDQHQCPGHSGGDWFCLPSLWRQTSLPRSFAAPAAASVTGGSPRQPAVAEAGAVLDRVENHVHTQHDTRDCGTALPS